MSNSSNSTQSSSSNSSNNSSDTAITITSTIVGGIVLVVIAYLIIRCVQRIKTQKLNSYVRSFTSRGEEFLESNSPPIEDTQYLSMTTESILGIATIESFLEELQNEKPIRLTPQHLKEFTNNFSEQLGSGGFGVAYKGRFPNGVYVAVKVLKMTRKRDAEGQFMAEVSTIGRTYHINLVRLYGFCFDPQLKALVYEFMENGSLDRYLFDPKRTIEWAKLYEIALGTAKGIRYLHEECQRRIIHYDIKPANVLLDAGFSPKVADFGLAKLCNVDVSRVTNTGGRGTPGYAAPELWLPLPVSFKCDVYSYGMLLFEIIGGRKNLEFDREESQEWFPNWVWRMHEEGKMSIVRSACGIGEVHGEKVERMCKVALWCVQYKPDGRPSMSNVVRMLEGEEEIDEPPNPFQYLTADGIGLHVESSSSSSITITSSCSSVATLS
ncbi:hypothetical protein HPP92_010768 [Vanilla planifolia]|uniref:Protein kinase domain-containing protein n=1 Tax=Vanilla planifolia TaxID=51239 RepID=A0A835R1I3_VANPL|nr:hypothetical protein HPP92_010768 [Vanilla planifolia]